MDLFMMLAPRWALDSRAVDRRDRLRLPFEGPLH